MLRRFKDSQAEMRLSIYKYLISSRNSNNISPTAKYEDVDKYFKIKTRCMDGTYTADKIKQYDEIKEEED